MILYLNPSQHFRPVIFFRPPTIPQPVEEGLTYGHGVREFVVFEGPLDSDSGSRIYDPLLRLRLNVSRVRKDSHQLTPTYILDTKTA